jgi:hypothetical protein
LGKKYRKSVKNTENGNTDLDRRFNFTGLDRRFEKLGVTWVAQLEQKIRRYLRSGQVSEAARLALVASRSKIQG